MRSAPAGSTVHLLVNPAAGRGLRDVDAVSERLVANGYKVERVEPSGPTDVAAALERVAPNRVVAVGGDGLVHHALPALVGTEIALGIVPSGTGNDFARALGLPRRRSAAVDRALGPATAVDLLRVEHGDGAETHVATSVTAGFSGRVNATANAIAFPKGQLKYTVASLMELRRLESFDLRIRGEAIDETAISARCTFFAAANTRYFGGGMAIAPTADATDGSFNLTTVAAVPAWKLALVLPTVFFGQHVRHPSVTEAVATHLDLEHREDIWADGEQIGAGPMTVAVAPKAIFVAAL